MLDELKAQKAKNGRKDTVVIVTPNQSFIVKPLRTNISALMQVNEASFNETFER